MIKRIAVVVLAALMSVAGARGQDPDARDRFLEQLYNFNREKAKTDAKVKEFLADKARDEAKYDQDRITLRDEVLALGRDVEVRRGEIATLEATLAARREHLIEAVVKHRFALAKIEAMPWRRPKADKPTP